MKTYFSNILPTQEVAEEKYQQYQARVDAVGGMVEVHTLEKMLETNRTTVVATKARGEVTETVENTETVLDIKGPALYITLPDGVDISTVLLQGEEMTFKLLSLEQAEPVSIEMAKKEL